VLLFTCGTFYPTLLSLPYFAFFLLLIMRWLFSDNNLSKV
jgi:hypothetical protein